MIRESKTIHQFCSNFIHFHSHSLNIRFVESPAVEGAILSHLSGSCSRKGEVDLVFHWLVPSTSTDYEPCYYDHTYDELDFNWVVPSGSEAAYVLDESMTYDESGVNMS